MRPTIFLVDDDRSFRTALARLLTALNFEVRAFSSGAEFVKNRPSNDTYGCIVLDFDMAGLSGLDVQDQLNRLGLTVPIIFLSGRGTIEISVQAMKKGADDFLVKPVAGVTLRAAIMRALENRSARQGHADVSAAMHARVGTLTPRQKEVYELVVQGMLNKQVAHILGTTERTVKAHRHEVMTKMQVGSLAQLVSIAERLGTLSAVRTTGGDHIVARETQTWETAARMSASG